MSVSYSDYKVVFTNDLVRTNNEDYSYKVSDDKYYMFDEKRNIVMLNSNRGLVETLHCDDETVIVDSAGIIDDEMSDEEKEECTPLPKGVTRKEYNLLLEKIQQINSKYNF